MEDPISRLERGMFEIFSASTLAMRSKANHALQRSLERPPFVPRAYLISLAVRKTRTIASEINAITAIVLAGDEDDHVPYARTTSKAITVAVAKSATTPSTVEKKGDRPMANENTRDR